MPSEIALADIRNVTLDTVELSATEGDVLRFHTYDPTIYTAEPELDITFFGVRTFAPSGRLSDVCLRETTLPAEFAGSSLVAFEFIHREIRPTHGRPYQAEILTNGTSRILHGQEVEQRRALVVAEKVLITEVTEE